MFCEVRSRIRRVAPVAVLVVGAAACGGKSRPPARVTDRPAPTVQVGACGEPERDGIVGVRPRPDRDDRDLDGDGVPEVVVADRGLCTAEGNCWWNVFRRGGEGDEACARYAGTLAAASLEPLAARGDDGFADVRAYWNLTSNGRFLVQDYRYVRGGYQVADALLCRRESDDRLLCSEDER